MTPSAMVWVKPMAATVVSVSYTHLDVYKRQHGAFREKKKQHNGPIRRNRLIAVPSIWPVIRPNNTVIALAIFAFMSASSALADSPAETTIGRMDQPLEHAEKLDSRPVSTVSYTHLDVYKRQPSRNRPTRTPCGTSGLQPETNTETITSRRTARHAPTISSLAPHPETHQGWVYSCLLYTSSCFP